MKYCFVNMAYDLTFNFAFFFTVKQERERVSVIDAGAWSDIPDFAFCMHRWGMIILKINAIILEYAEVF